MGCSPGVQEAGRWVALQGWLRCEWVWRWFCEDGHQPLAYVRLRQQIERHAQGSWSVCFAACPFICMRRILTKTGVVQNPETR